MRLIHTAPLAAAILLAACGGDADTNGDGEAGLGEEVVAEAAGRSSRSRASTARRSRCSSSTCRACPKR